MSGGLIARSFINNGLIYNDIFKLASGLDFCYIINYG
jgi:hypothetical protein